MDVESSTMQELLSYLESGRTSLPVEKTEVIDEIKKWGLDSGLKSFNTLVVS